MTETNAPNGFKIGMTLKGASGYEAEWLTPSVYGATADETAERAVALIKALADRGVIDLVSHAAVKMRESHQPSASRGGSAPKTFQGGRVQSAPQAPASTGVAGDNCPHGRTHRKGTSARGEWEAMFCSAPQKPDQCKALFLQKDGSWA
ncbi:hypothetical protein [Streptomyces sp. NPDC051546]|uniref:hypothetical protein n=1 Tax=Streptomyces sp. NPDC051546 TaxID=3365655 RepID=UPI0037B88618